MGMKNYKPIILGLDTSCDETSAGVTHGDAVLSNVISSQIDLHKIWGGVVPDIARRAHQERIDEVIEKSLILASRNFKKKINLENVDAVAVTYGPGLAIALEVGIEKAKEISKKYNKPLIAVNHLEGHLLSAMAKDSLGEKGLTLSKRDFPALGLIISGKHTEIVLVRNIGDYEVVGETLDDAIGEAYDKVGRMLELGYPAGPIVTKFAKLGDSSRFSLPIPMRNKKDSLDFSFSGLKTAVYYMVKKDLGVMSKQDVYDMCASFENSAILHLQDKLELAINKYNPKLILVGGGVASSPKVRASIRKTTHNFGLKAYFPNSNKLYMDNGAMIGLVASNKYVNKDFVANLIDLEREPRASLNKP